LAFFQKNSIEESVRIRRQSLFATNNAQSALRKARFVGLWYRAIPALLCFMKILQQGKTGRYFAGVFQPRRFGVLRYLPFFLNI